MEAQSLPIPAGIALPRSRRLLGAFSDARLVEHVRRGNEAAFEVIFDRHHRAILSFCRHMLGSPDEAEDAVQQTFVSAYDAMRSDTRELKLKAWLYAIARNKCLSILRARRERPSELEDVPTAGLAEEVQQRADLRELLHDMRELPEEQRAALVLSELGDLSHADIGAVVGCDPVKVKSLVFQARSSLIENRNARETPCPEIREELATARGGALRRGPLRKHLKACAGCRAFREDVTRQRAMAALVLPVVPSVGLKSGALAAMGIGGGGAGLAAAGGGAALGGAAVGGTAVGTGTGAVATAGGVKLATVVIAAVALGGGGVAVKDAATTAEPSHSSAATSGTLDRDIGKPVAGGQSGVDPAVAAQPGAAGLPELAADRAAERRDAHGRPVKADRHQGRGEHTKGENAKDGSAKGENPRADEAKTDRTGPQRDTNNGKGAERRDGRQNRDSQSNASATGQERKAARGPRVDQPLVIPGVVSAMPDPPVNKGRRKRGAPAGSTPAAE
jgi:RNA polymerase sigma factor (sigma-70 family)